METLLKTQGEHRYKFHCPICHPSRDTTKNTIPYINQVITEKTVYLRCPAQFCTLRTAIFTTYLKRMCKCTPNHTFFFCFFTLNSYGHFFFLRVCGSVIYPWKKKKGILVASQRLVGTKERVKIRTRYQVPGIVERGIADQPFWQRPWLAQLVRVLYLVNSLYSHAACRTKATDQQRQRRIRDHNFVLPSSASKEGSLTIRSSIPLALTRSS